MRAKSLQWCPALGDYMDSCPPGSSLHGILQGRILEWVAVPSSKGSSWPKDGTHVSSALAGRFFATESPGKRLDSYVTLGKVLKLSHLNFLTCKMRNYKHISLVRLNQRGVVRLWWVSQYIGNSSNSTWFTLNSQCVMYVLIPSPTSFCRFLTDWISCL